MWTAVKVALLAVLVLVSIIVYAFAYVNVVGAIHHVKAAGINALYYSPLFWLLMAVIVGLETWLGKRIVWN
jgi:hypothetical protein